MVIVVSGEIARGEENPPPLFPYATATYNEHPWIPRIAAHPNALAAWQSKNNGSRKKAIAFHIRLRRHYRCTFSAEMCNAWTQFGGLAAHLSHFAVILSRASLESAGYATRYRELRATTLADYARARFPIDYHTALSEVHEDTRGALAWEIASVAVRFTPAGASNEHYQRFPNGKSRSKGEGKGTAQKGRKGCKRSGATAIARERSEQHRSSQSLRAGDRSAMTNS